MTYVKTEPEEAAYLRSVKLVGECLGRSVSLEDLDTLAEHGVFIDEWWHLLYDVERTFLV